jgi:hypothetical protein
VKKKALVLGAQPEPFRGPYVDISDGKRWVLEVPSGIMGTVHGLMEDGTELTAVLEDEMTLEDWEKVAVEVTAVAPFVEFISINVRCVDA